MDASRNILNTEDVDAYVKRLLRGHDMPKHVAAWWNSTFRRWLLQEYPGVVPVVLESELRNPLLLIARAVLQQMGVRDFDQHVRSGVHLLKEEDAPEWALLALQKRQNLVFFKEPLSQQTDVWQHWIDFCRTLPERSIRHTVPHMEKAVADYDKSLARQKLRQSLSVGVTIIDTTVFDNLTPVTCLVRLDTKEAYAAEGAAMHHCVASYWKREKTQIFSLRQIDARTPIATIEIYANSVDQIKGPANKEVAPEIADLIRVWATQSGFTWFTICTTDDDDEYGEEEYEEGQEEEDWYEEDGE